MEIIERLASLDKSFGPMDRRLSLDNKSNCVLDLKLTTQNKQQLMNLDLYKEQDDEGEIMLLAMILLQLHGVKLPSSEQDDLLNKKKRQRTNPDQLAILEQIFQTDKMPNQQTRVQLADQLGMSSRRVQIWFQNKRAKVKRSSSKPDEECSSPNSLNQSSSSISPLSSPSSPSVPLVDEDSSNESQTASPSVVPDINCKFLDDSVIISSASSRSLLSSDSATQLKPQQLFSQFVDNQPVLTASY